MAITSGFTGANTGRTGGVLFIGDPLNLGANQLARAEAIVIQGSGAIRADDSIVGNEVILRDCSIFIDGLDSPFSTLTAVLSYASATEKRSFSSAADLTLDRCLLIQRESAGVFTRRHYFIANLYNTTIVCEGNKTGFLVTDFNAKVLNLYLKSLNGYQPAGPFSYAVGLTLDATDFLFANFGRLETEGLTLLNQSARPIQMVGGGGVFNSLYLWNRSSSVDSTKYYITNATAPATGGAYPQGYKGEHILEGYTASWLFVNQSDSSPIEDVKVCYYDDIANIYEYTGSLAKKAEYITDADGKLVGTWDTRSRTNGASQVRETLFLLTNRTNTYGSDYQAPGSPQSYSLQPTTKQIAVKSYLHSVSPAFKQGANYELTNKIGAVNELFAASTFEKFFLGVDESITETNKTTVDNYTELESPEKFYDRSKSAWYDNESYPLLTREGNTIDAGNYNIAIDANAASVFTFDGSTITIKATQYIGNIISSGTFTLLNGAEILGTYGATTVLPWTVTNVEAGSTVQLYNITKDIQIENYITSGSGTKITATGSYSSIEAEAGDTIRLRVTCQVGLQALEPFETFGVATTAGIAFRADQVADAIYNANNIDGSNITGITLSPDYINIQIDINDNEAPYEVTAQQIYNYYSYIITTTQGIANFFGAISPIDQVNYRINSTIAPIKIQNTGSTDVVINGGRLYRDDNVSIIDTGVGSGSGSLVHDTGFLLQFIQPQVDAATLSLAKDSDVQTIKTDVQNIKKKTNLIPAALI
jgi:hypothetical protein